MLKNISINDRNVRIQLWDTAGSEAYRSITRSYYKNSTCAFIVYDITSSKTFYDVRKWLQDCRELCYKNVLIYLIGNKIDLEDIRQVTYEEGKKFADENGLIFYETSALTGKNIEDIFINSATELVNKLESGDFNNDYSNAGIKIFQFPNKGVENKMLNKNKGCCS
jgi:small GTP-binding protein